MPSIRQFRTVISERDSVRRLSIQTPLTAVANRPDIGWITKITFAGEPLSGSNRRRWFATVRRVTTPVSRTRNVLRRRLGDHPRTTDTLTLYPGRVGFTTDTHFDRLFWSSASPTFSTARLSFALADLLPLLRGCVETGEGRPLADWLVENATEIAPYLCEAGWLPETWEEFEAVKRKRDEENKASAEDDEYDDHDRWR